MTTFTTLDQAAAFADHKSSATGLQYVVTSRKRGVFKVFPMTTKPRTSFVVYATDRK